MHFIIGLQNFFSVSRLMETIFMCRSFHLVYTHVTMVIGRDRTVDLQNIPPGFQHISSNSNLMLAIINHAFITL